MADSNKQNYIHTHSYSHPLDPCVRYFNLFGTRECVNYSLVNYYGIFLIHGCNINKYVCTLCLIYRCKYMYHKAQQLFISQFSRVSFVAYRCDCVSVDGKMQISHYQTNVKCTHHFVHKIHKHTYSFVKFVHHFVTIFWGEGRRGKVYQLTGLFRYFIS